MEEEPMSLRNLRPAFVASILVAMAAATTCERPVCAQDCPEPAGPWFLGSAEAVAVDKGYAYFGSVQTFRIATISNSAPPQIVGEVALPGIIFDVELSNGHAFVADFTEGLRIIDVGVPSAPFETGWLDTPGFANGVAVAGGYAYVADFGSLRVIDVGLPSAPSEVGSLDTPGISWDVAVTGTYAYLADNDGVRVIDVSAPSTPAVVGFAPTAYSAWVIDQSGDRALVASAGGLHVIDVSDPSSPSEEGFLAIPGSNTSGLAEAASLVYVANGSGGLRVIDVSDPVTPFEVCSFSTPGTARGVALRPGDLFLTDDAAGLTAFRTYSLFFGDFHEGDTTAWTTTVP